MSKKVLLLSHFPPPAGGIASWTKRLLEIGLPNDWEIDHVNINTIGGRDPFKNTKKNIFVETKRCLNIWKKEFSFLKKDKDILVVHTCIPCTPLGMLRETVSAIMARFYHKPFILHCRCTVPNVVNKKWKLMIWYVLTKFCDGIIVLNQKSLHFVKSNSDCKCILIPNFVSSDEILEVKNRSYDNVRHILYTGGVTIEKGCQRIINAAHFFPSIIFDLVGVVSSDIEKLEKPDNVIIHGNKDKDYISKCLEKADLFLFLSKYWGEGFSNSLVEAMAAGLPCIVSDWAANKDQIENKGGIVLNDDTVESLVNAIDIMIKNRDFRKNASIWNIGKVNDSYVDKIVTLKYVRFYDCIIKDR